MVFFVRPIRNVLGYVGKAEPIMRKIISLLLLAILLLPVAPPHFGPALAADKAALDNAIARAAAYMQRVVENPGVGSVGGDWAVIGLARSAAALPDSYYAGYYKAVEKLVKENKGVLHDRKYSEYSRVILGLTAAGYDPRDVGGYDLTLPLGDFERTIWQGINGPLWALLALDSRDYPVPVNPEAKTQASRDQYIEEILRRQLEDGGWSLTAGNTGEINPGQKSDPDVCAMVLQALAKYQDKPEVRAATSKALAYLSRLQEDDGGYSGWGDPNSETVVQVLVALCELGISVDDARFVKNGKSVLDNVLSYQNADGSFRHTTGGAGENQMASEQALYCLAAAWRAAEGKNSLYNMKDTRRRASLEAAVSAGLPARHADVQKTEIRSPGKTFDDVKGHRSQAAIEALASRGIIGGRTAERFDPDATMSRAEYAAIVTRALGLPQKTSSVFTDVRPSAWYAAAIGTAYHYQLVSGVSATSFLPEGTITRQEAAVMTARAAKLAGMDTAMQDFAVRNTLAQFDDYREVAEWAGPLLAFCYAEGILDSAAMTIRPRDAVLRCEVAEMLYNMLDKVDLL